MRCRTFPSPLVLVLIAANGRSQAPQARSAMGLALRCKDEHPEHAAELLRRAWLLCERLDDRERRDLQGEVVGHLRDLDRHGVRLLRAQRRMLDDLRRFAASCYRDVGWFRTADRLLAAGAAILPEAVADARKAAALGPSLRR